MAWLLLLGAAVLEVVWAAALERSAGFSRPWPSVVGITAAVAGFVLLTMALRDLPLGTAYAVWVGLGATGVAAVGILALGESAAPARLLCLALIVAGVVGLKLL
ncbi:multidrug efflux SMR transporter [Actinosynnema sp. NPDC047251]|uniref:Putative membrane protein n=1 Tax=Saccharothrix espanaensis (strain ATCC 51144 / DSM 44229 / JCM 9112 / NBRC 15066 / NRRL 15764) TaxID=1179773 RepID=K0KF79_SACES|nr:multidrug efflux SMR transporter [Saccharothrix espanaensis]CCH35439.1 putative membrane protein [Saccharothrix espanaensis DSM 44229]